MSASLPRSAAPLDRWGERLPRRLGLWSAVAAVVGSTIGSGIFRTPASIAQRVDDVPLFLLSWVLGGAVTLCGALTYAELAALFPRSGGIYVFIREAFGPLPAFLFGWAELLIIRPGAYGAISITSAAYTLRVLGLRSEEHTSELQSPCNLVCRLLLEKKKKKQINNICSRIVSKEA